MWQQAVIEKYNISGPRYTSYPTAIQFEDIEKSDDFVQAIDKLPLKHPISLYIHIPFCSNICYYCACTKVISKDSGKAIPYLNSLYKEIDQLAVHVGVRPVTQLHFGGGTPTFLNIEQLTGLMDKLKRSFNLQLETGEFSIEVDPRSVDIEKIQQLYRIGFNRLSLGIQDFNERVQQAINRVQSESEIKKIITAAQVVGFQSISVDLIYGLPFQTIATFRDTINRIIMIKPDRVSVFSYAHLPHRFKPQRLINSPDLPNPNEKLAILELCINALTAVGYCYIGMDHFALPDDALAVAQQQGMLHRNFQGYTTHGECALLGLGVSSISSINSYYYQNQNNLTSYYNTISQGKLPCWRGYKMDTDDKIRCQLIMQLICHFELRFADIEKYYGIRFSDYFKEELLRIKTMKDDGLIVINDEVIKVTAVGRILVRNICMVFDKYLIGTLDSNNYSRAI